MIEKIEKHNLVPKHILLKQEEKKKLLENLNISITQLPKIHKKDPAISHFEPKVGDIIKIIRNSPTALKSEYYRVVVNE